MVAAEDKKDLGRRSIGGAIFSGPGNDPLRNK
jgi:hypothetical protein